jgi:hypothetical protein
VESRRGEERERSQALQWRAKKFYTCVLKLQLFSQQWIRRTSGTPAKSAEEGWVLIGMCSTKFPGHEAGTVRALGPSSSKDTQKCGFQHGQEALAP